MVQCAVCETPIDGYHYVNPLFGEVACPPCASRHQCTWCGRFSPTSLQFGYQICHRCESTAISDTSGIMRLVAAAQPILSTHVGPNRLGELPVDFIGPADDSKHLGFATYGTSGGEIVLWPGMPFGYALGVLCHEYGHMALNLYPTTLALRPNCSSRPRMIEEGFCEVMNAVALLTQWSDDARHLSFMLPGNSDPVYGDGFRLMWSRVQEVGTIGALIEELTDEPHLHRGPLVGSIDDDFEIPVDIAPLVDSSASSRELGPLRGTAVKAKDLPPDAPTGPRLRGKGLSILERPSTRSDVRLRGKGIEHIRDGDAGTSTTSGLRGRGLTGHN